MTNWQDLFLFILLLPPILALMMFNVYLILYLYAKIRELLEDK